MPSSPGLPRGPCRTSFHWLRVAQCSCYYCVPCLLYCHHLLEFLGHHLHQGNQENRQNQVGQEFRLDPVLRKSMQIACTIPPSLVCANDILHLITRCSSRSCCPLFALSTFKAIITIPSSDSHVALVPTGTSLTLMPKSTRFAAVT